MLMLAKEILTLSQTSPGFYVSGVQVCCKHCGKGEIAHYEQFLLFPQCFILFWRTLCLFIKLEIVVCKPFQIGRVYFFSFWKGLTLSSIYTDFNTLKKKALRKTLWRKVKSLKMSNFIFFPNVFYTICILKSFNSHISVVVCSFFEFGTVSEWCIREWINAFL